MQFTNALNMTKIDSNKKQDWEYENHVREDRKKDKERRTNRRQQRDSKRNYNSED